MRGSMAAMLGAMGLLAVATTATAASAATAGPELARCPRLDALDEPLNDRTRPLPVPAAFARLVASGREQFAVATIAGTVVCVDTRPMTRVSGFRLSEDRRFLEFDWLGYEADGHIVVDRTGKGQVIDTGVAPVVSPSRRRFAAVQQSEAAFGSLEGFGVWQLGAVGLRELALLQDIPSLADWRIDGWAGDDCINLSGIPYDRFPAPDAKLARLRRDRFIARPAGGRWRVTPAAAGCPAEKQRK